MDPKQLKKLVKVCRELGVKTYKGDGFEFTLSDEAPVKETRRGAFTKTQNELMSATFESDSFEDMTLEQQLFWSAQDPQEQPQDTE